MHAGVSFSILEDLTVPLFDFCHVRRWF